MENIIALVVKNIKTNQYIHHAKDLFGHNQKKEMIIGVKYIITLTIGLKKDENSKKQGISYI